MRDIGGRVLLVFFVAAAWLSLGGCAAAPLDYPRRASATIDVSQETRLSRQLAPQLAAHSGQSAFILLDNGPGALVARLALIDAADRTIDAQCFLLGDDVSGTLVIEHLFAAADRGVRVRLLVDDWNQAKQDSRLAAIDGHVNVELRIFNPSGDPRWCALTRQVEYALGPSRTRRRMHNKTLVVDNIAGVVGGRNIADEYFSAGEDHNFGDLDLVVAGPVVRDVSGVFDRYWNDRLSVPAGAFVQDGRRDKWVRELQESLQRHRKASTYGQYVRELGQVDLLSQLASGRPPLVWGEAEFLYDLPGKIVSRSSDAASSHMVSRLSEILQTTQFEALMITPYLVPGEKGADWFRQVCGRGVRVKILTNSLASTDEMSTYGAYERYRARLLRYGVELYEFRPRADGAGKDYDDRPDRALHAKCMVLDRHAVLIGSLNLDRRSVRLDTQDGIVVWSDVMAARVKGLFDRNIDPRSAYHLMLRGSLNGSGDGRLVWVGQDDGKQTLQYDNPDTGPLRRFRAWILSWLVPEEWL